jgi:hypothetical protein
MLWQQVMRAAISPDLRAANVDTCRRMLMEVRLPVFMYRMLCISRKSWEMRLSPIRQHLYFLGTTSIISYFASYNGYLTLVT